MSSFGRFSNRGDQASRLRQLMSRPLTADPARGEELVDRIARTADGSAAAENSMVRIQDIVGEIAIVSPVQQV